MNRMSSALESDRLAARSWSRDDLREYQLRRLNQLLSRVIPQNAFYAEKLQGKHVPFSSLDALEALPLTRKSDLQPERAEEIARNHTFAKNQYVRLHQTSGTQGRPLIFLDTKEDWQWWTSCWQHIFDCCGVTANDRVFPAFSFGPFVGFWSAHDAAIERGCVTIPSGGMNTAARLELMRTAEASVVCCTPSHALRMAEVAKEQQIDLAGLNVRCLIVAGEPGGSLPGVRDRIESAWNARVFDHAGATEVGPWGLPDEKREGLMVLESEFIAEFVSLENGGPAQPGERAELVLTNLGRYGAPVFRYRTGDVVVPIWDHDRNTRFVWLKGGILGRVDDMIVFKGVNVFPSALEEILRQFAGVLEYRATARRDGEMDQVDLEVELSQGSPEEISLELRKKLGVRIPVQSVPRGSLPRHEGKGRRFVDHR